MSNMRKALRTLLLPAAALAAVMVWRAVVPLPEAPSPGPPSNVLPSLPNPAPGTVATREAPIPAIAVTPDAGKPGRLQVRVSGRDVRWMEADGLLSAGTLPGAGSIQAPGGPSLPEVLQVFEVPMDEEVRVTAVTEDWKEAAFDGALAFHGRWPEQSFSVDHVIGGRRKFARVAYYPVQLDGDRGVVRTGDLVFNLDRVSAEIPPVRFSTDTVPYAPTSGGDPAASWMVRSELLPEPLGRAEDFARRRPGDVVDACVKVRIQQPGIYKLTRSALVAAGVDASLLRGDQFRLFYRDREIAIRVSRDDLFTAPDDHILFFAEGLATANTLSNYVWLGFGPGGLRWEQRDGTPLSGATPETNYAGMRILEDDHVKFSASVSSLVSAQASLDGYDGWGLGTVTKWSSTLSLKVDVVLEGTDHPVPNGSQALTMGVWANAAGPHDMRVKDLFTNIEWSQHVFSGVGYHEVTASLANRLTAASHVIQVYPTQLSQGKFLQWLRLDFDRYLHLRNGHLAFAGSNGPRNYRLQSVTNPTSLVILDLLDPWEPVQVVNGSAQPGSAFLFGQTGEELRAYVAAQAEGVRTVAAADILLRSNRRLADPGRSASYVVITPAAFVPEVKALLEHRDLAGEEVCVATLDEIYDEFGYGCEGPEPIKQFIGFAFHHWKQAPRNVLLVGDGHYAPLSAVSSPNHVPVPMGASRETWTAFDIWYGTVNGNDWMLDVPIGRLPIETSAQLASVIQRTRDYEALLAASDRTNPASWRRRVTLVADYDPNRPEIPGELFSFASYTTSLASTVLAQTNTTVTSRILDAAGTNRMAIRSGIMQDVNSGLFSLSYMGHGSSTAWSTGSVSSTADDLFNDLQAKVLANSPVFPLVTVWTCLNGAFHDYAKESLPEVMLRYGSHGAVAMVAPTGLVQAEIAHWGSVSFYEALLLDRYIVGFEAAPIFEQRDTRTLGEVFQNMNWGFVLRASSNAGTVKAYALFGDPGLVVDPETAGEK